MNIDYKNLTFDGDLFQSSSIHKILLIRSGQMDIVNDAIKSLRDGFPTARIDVLCQPVVLSEVKQIPTIDEVFIYDHPFFNLRKIGWKRLITFRRKAYDLIVIVFSNSSGEGYNTVKLVAVALGSKRIATFNLLRKWSVIQLKPFAYMKGFLKELVFRCGQLASLVSLASLCSLVLAEAAIVQWKKKIRKKYV
jgi:hypothetical protein